MTKKIVILGAGVSGLSAAYRLLKAGQFNVTVIDKQPYVGGLSISVSKDDITSDLGPHRIYSQFKEVDKLLTEIVPDEIITVPRKSRMYLDDKFIKYPPSIISLIKELGPKKAATYAIGYLSKKITAILENCEETSYEGWMRLAYGDKIYEDILYPYAKKAWKVEPKQLSADLAILRLAGGKGMMSFAAGLLGINKKKNPLALQEFQYVKGGMGYFCDQLADRIRDLGGEIILNNEINSIIINENRLIEEVVLSNDSMRIRGDYFISTIPITRLVSLLAEKINSPMIPAIKKINESIAYISMICVFIVIKKPQFSQDTWLYFPKEDVIFNRVYEAKNFDESLCPPDKTVLCFEITDFAKGQTWNLKDNDLILKVISDCEKIGMFNKSEILTTFTYRIPEAYPIYDLIYKVKLQKLWEFLKLFKNIITVGRQGLFNHNNMDHSLYMGIEAADFLTGGNPESARWYTAITKFDNFKIVD